MMMNKINTVIYAGVTGDLMRRIYEHKSKIIKGFTNKYNVSKLVYYEIYDNVIDAIAREKQIKGGSRKKKMDLIEKENPEFNERSLE
jgi:putative endonuclease